MICFPNAKINLGLRILRKRPDGYHELETIMVPVGFNDVLEAVVSAENSFQASGTGLEGPVAHNLVVKAWELLGGETHLPPLRVHLHKNIPVQAGLGGGSSDASFALKLFNGFASPECTRSSLLEMAARIGSDCPFFIDNRPAMVRGRGDLLEEVDPGLKGYYAGIVVPDVSVSTVEAYRHVVPSASGIPLDEAVRKPVEEWKEHIFNGFEPYFFKKHPGLKRLKTSLYDKGAVFALMSGSGSAFYGIFKEKPGLSKHFGDLITWEGPLPH